MTNTKLANQQNDLIFEAISIDQRHFLLQDCIFITEINILSTLDDKWVSTMTVFNVFKQETRKYIFVKNNHKGLKKWNSTDVLIKQMNKSFYHLLRKKEFLGIKITFNIIAEEIFLTTTTQSPNIDS